MYSIYLEFYIGFVSLIFLVLLALGLMPTRRESYSQDKNYNLRVLVVMPCKGREINLEGNLKAAQNQNYRNYKFVTVVESVRDPAFKAIKKAGVDYLLADIKCRNCSGKVRNLCSAFRKYDNYELYVILDSDVTVNEHWLELLVAPFSNKSIGMATAFPEFRPVGGFWSHVKHCWGYVGFGLMENERTRFGWGGTLAFRSVLLKDKRHFAHFRESVADDIALTSINKSLGFRIAYVPESNPVIDSNDNFARFAEWSTRQTAFTLVANGTLFYVGMLFYLSNLLLLVSGLGLGLLVNPVFLVFLVPFLIGLARVYRRSRGSLDVLAVYPIMNFVYIFNLLKASRLQRVKWRGRVYSVRPAAKLEVQ